MVNRISSILIRAMVGALGGFLVGFGIETFIPTLNTIFVAATSFSASIVLSAFGLLIGSLIGFDSMEFAKLGHSGNNDVNIPIREEKLDIDTHKVKIADVDIHKEVISEEKTVSIPLFREELVVEKTVDDHESKETMRIPLSEERLDVDKKTVQLNDVSVYKKEFEETETVGEKVKKETVHIDKD